MIDSKQVKPDMAVLGSDNTECAIVDHLEGLASIKLKKDAQGQHHFIPLSWVASVDEKVKKIRLDRTGDKMKGEWKTTAT